MTERSPVLDLMSDGVPLRLLFDLAGFADSSVDICAAERPVPAPPSAVGMRTVPRPATRPGSRRAAPDRVMAGAAAGPRTGPLP